MKKKVIVMLATLIVVALVIMKLATRDSFFYAGTIEATEVDISAQLSAIIDEVKVKEGEAVSKNQKIVELNCNDLRLAASVADKDFKRAQTLKAAGSMPEETYDRLRFKKDDTALRLSWCQIESPLDGVVLDRYREPGEFVGPGVKILTLADLSEVWTLIYVPEAVMASLSLGQIVDMMSPHSERQFQGKITHIRDEAEFTPKNVQTREERTRLVYGVKITFDNKDRYLKPGMTVEVKLGR